MPDWNTRLAVSIVETPGGATDITPIDSFAPTFAVTAEPIHSLEATHIGVIYQPPAITFSMTVKAIGEAVGKLTALAMDGKRFDIILQRSENGGDDWSFHSIVLSECIITNAQPTTANVTGAPSATFTGVSLKATAETKTAGVHSIGHR